MGLKKLAGKIADYNKRLEADKAHKIKPDHVRKVLGKLRAKQDKLQQHMASAHSDDKKARLQRKLKIAETHIERAEFLLEALTSEATAS